MSSHISSYFVSECSIFLANFQPNKCISQANGGVFKVTDIQSHFVIPMMELLETRTEINDNTWKHHLLKNLIGLFEKHGFCYPLLGPTVMLFGNTEKPAVLVDTAREIFVMLWRFALNHTFGMQGLGTLGSFHESGCSGRQLPNALLEFGEICPRLAKVRSDSGTKPSFMTNEIFNDSAKLAVLHQFQCPKLTNPIVDTVYFVCDEAHSFSTEISKTYKKTLRISTHNQLSQ